MDTADAIRRSSWGVAGECICSKEGRNVFAHAHEVTMRCAKALFIGDPWTRRTRSAAPWGVAGECVCSKEGRNMFAHAHEVTMRCAKAFFIGDPWTRRMQSAAP